MARSASSSAAASSRRSNHLENRKTHHEKCAAATQFCFLDLLPFDLIRFLVSGYCDGRSLSSFLVAVSSSATHRSRGFSAVRGALADRFQSLQNILSKDQCVFVEKVLNHFVSPIDTSGDTDCMDNHYIEEDDMAALALGIGQWSQALAVLSFLEDYCTTTTTTTAAIDDHPQSKFEWPVWCGILRMQFAEYDSPRGARIEQARVVVTTPSWHPCLVERWRHTMEQQHLYASLFTPQPRRFHPLAPLGRMRGSSREDCITLSCISQQLNEYDEVALPPHTSRRRPGGSVLLNDIKIISRQQAHQRLQHSELPYRPDNLWPLDNVVQDQFTLPDDSELFAFWDNCDDDDYDSTLIPRLVDEIIHLMSRCSGMDD